MIGHLLELDELPPATQDKLFELLERHKDYDALARMCALANLSDSVDERLGAIGAAQVRSAWVSRPGRDPAEVHASLRREKRVGVLTALAEMELSDPALYAVIAEANSSPTVATALLLSPHATVQARKVAAQRLARAADENKRVELDRVRAEVVSDLEVLTAFAGVASGPATLAVAMLADDLDDGTATGLVGRLDALLSATAAEVVDPQRTFEWRQTQQLRHAANVLTGLYESALTRSWVTAEHRSTMAATLTRAAATVASWARANGSNNWTVTDFATAAKAWETLAAGAGNPAATGGSRAAELTTAARDARTKDDATQLLTTLRSNGENALTQLVVRELMVNPHLDVESRLEAAREFRWSYRLFMNSEFTNYPIETWVAAALVNPYLLNLSAVDATGRGPEFAALMVGNVLHAARPELLAAQMAAAHMLDGQLVLELPAGLVWSLLESDETPRSLRRDVAEFIRQQIESDPVTTWEMFDSMAATYAGTLPQLVAVCRAATGTDPTGQQA